MFCKSIARLFALCLAACLVTHGGPATAQEPWFAIETLNDGLGPAPDRVVRSSPKATMESFLDLTEASDVAAAHLLNLNDIPDTDQPAAGRALSRELAVLIDRKVVVNWNQLLARPDALDAAATSDSAVAGQARKSLLIAVIDGPKRPLALRLNRVKPGDADPVWVFSAESVANIAPLHALYGPTALEQALPDILRRDAFWSLMWWEVIALPLVVALATLAGIAVSRVLSRLAESDPAGIMGRALRASRLPAIIAAVTLVVALTRHVFVFSGLISAFLTPAIALGFVLATLIFLVNVVDQLLDLFVRDDDYDLSAKGREQMRARATKISVARRLVIIVVFLVGVAIVLGAADLYATFGFSLLASAGVLTLVLGFAAREVLANILSSMQIALNQSARIGDKVLFRDHLCNVERINFTYVQLRVWTGVRLIVPVREFVSESFENWSLREPELIRRIELTLAHDAPVARMREAFQEIVAEIDPDELGSQDDTQALVTGQDVFGQKVTFCLACANPNTAWKISCDVREALIARAREMEGEEGVTLFPQANPAEAA